MPTTGVAGLREIWGGSSSLPFYAAATTVAVELTLHKLGVESALSMADEMWEQAVQAELPAVARYLAGMGVAVLAVAGRIGEAEQRWQLESLPDSHAGCLDLAGQSWREMEVMSCARLRLAAARGEFDEGRELLRELIDLTGGRGLRRTLMRALVLGIALEEAAGDRKAALGHLETFLDLYAETDYGWAVVRERRVTVPVLEAFRDGNPGSPLGASAEALLKASSTSPSQVAPLLSAREAEVLARLEQQDRPGDRRGTRNVGPGRALLHPQAVRQTRGRQPVRRGAARPVSRASALPIDPGSPRTGLASVLVGRRTVSMG